MRTRGTTTPLPCSSSGVRSTTGVSALSLLCPEVLLESDFIEAVWSFR